MRRSRRHKEKKPSNKLISFIIALVVIVLCVFFNAKGKEIMAQNQNAEEQIQELQGEIESEQDRSKELDEYAKYVNTKQFIEDMAREKLGLIYPDEIIFKSDDK